MTPEVRFGRLVRAAREGLEWSQEALARRAREELAGGFDQSAVARIEAGKRLVRLNEVEVLTRLLGIDVMAALRPDPRTTVEELDSALTSARGTLERQVRDVERATMALENAVENRERAVAERARTLALVKDLESRLQLAQHRFHGELDNGE